MGQCAGSCFGGVAATANRAPLVGGSAARGAPPELAAAVPAAPAAPAAPALEGTAPAALGEAGGAKAAEAEASTLEAFKAEAGEARSGEEAAKAAAGNAAGLDVSPAQNRSLKKYVVTPTRLTGEEDGVYPTDGAQVRVELAWRTLPVTGMLPEPLSQFTWDPAGCMRELTFVLGDCERCDALESAVASMKRGETAVLRCGAHGTGDPKSWTDAELGLIPAAPGRAVDMLVTLTYCEKEKDVMEMEASQRVRYAVERKDAAAKYFKAERYLSALNKYKLVADCLGYTEDMKDEDIKRDSNAALRAAKMNEVMCYLKLEDYSGGLKAASEVLDKEPENEKALYRRATCYLQMSEFVRAEADLTKCAQVNPQNTEAKRLLQQCRRGSREDGKNQKEAYSRMLSGYSKKTKPKDS